MPRRDDIKKANVLLDKELAKSYTVAIGSRKFSDEARLAVKEFVDLYNHSPEQFVKKVESMSSVLSKVNTSVLSKRWAVEFPKDDILKVQESLAYLRRLNIDLSQQKFIHIALTIHA